MGKTPDELAAKWDDVMWGWAYHNVVQDKKEQDALLFSLIDTLTWWLQPEIRRKMRNQKNSEKTWPQASESEYISELRQQGASESYIAKEIAALAESHDEGDDFKVIVGPNASKSNSP